MNKAKFSNQFRETVARVDLAALRENLALARELAGAGVSLMGVVKAQAYGHGAVPVAQTLAHEGIEALAVATPEEGLELRAAGLRTPIFILGGPFGAAGDLLVQNNLIPVVFTEAQLQHLQNTLSGPLKVHLKIDSGMTRLGIRPEHLNHFLSVLKKYPQLKLQGVLTHLARADETFEGATAEQYERFHEAQERVKKDFPEVEWVHMANSAALLGQELGGYNWARPGIMLYGANPHPRFAAARRLRPVMNFETQILSLKSVPAGTAVSYGGDWVAARPSQIAVLPVGYADGYLRALGNRAEVMIEGKRAPVVGRVCMDLTMIDVTQIPEVRLNQRVLLWGAGLPVEEVAAWGGTISYELLCQVSGRVPRIYEGGR